MYHAYYEGKLFNLEDHLSHTLDRKQEIETLKKRAEKGAYTCPHCEASLIVKAGDIRGIFFAHSPGTACVLTESYDTYKKQTTRESKQHSVMRDIVHEVLKNQEKIREDLQVDFGYIAKAEEKWTQFPDIVLKNGENELAISILTNVDRSRDSKLSKQIKKRNQYYKEKGLKTFWFIEEQELSLDWEKQVIHLWESEIDLSVKTEEDMSWDKLIIELNQDLVNILNLFGYWRKNSDIALETRSIYYIYSTQEGIEFSVHRFIIDETQFPYRAFALTKGYRMDISTALSFNEKLALSNPENESLDQKRFLQEYYNRKQQRAEEKDNQSHLNVVSSLNSVPSTAYKVNYARPANLYSELVSNQQVASTYHLSQPQQIKKMNYTEFKDKLIAKFGMTQKQQMHLWRHYVLKKGIKEFDQFWLVAEHLDTFDQFQEALNDYLTR